MDRIELEKLVRTIVEQVLEQILADSPTPKPIPQVKTNNQQKQGRPSDIHYLNKPGKTSDPEIFSDKHLLTERDMMLFSRSGVVKLIVNRNAILTPSAKDYAQAKRIQIQRGREPEYSSRQQNQSQEVVSQKVALYIPRSTESEKSAISGAIQKAGYQVVDFSNKTGAANLQTQVVQEIAKGISANQFKYAVVVNENAFTLSIQANKIDNIRAVVCWDTSSAKMSQQDASSNMLFLNNRLLGFRALNEITHTWLTSAQ